MNAIGTIIVTPVNTVSVASSTPAIFVNTALTAITHTTIGATGIGVPMGLPTGVTATWAANVITISGTPTVINTFYYSIPLTGGCGEVNATGTIMVYPLSDYLPLKVGSRYLYSNYASYSEGPVVFGQPGKIIGFEDIGECEWDFFDKTPTQPYVYRVRQTLSGLHIDHKYKLDLTSIELDTTLITNRIDTLTFQENENGTVTIKCPFPYWKYVSETFERYLVSSKTDTCFFFPVVNEICLTKNVGIKSLSFFNGGIQKGMTSYTLVKGPY